MTTLGNLVSFSSGHPRAGLGVGGNARGQPSSDDLRTVLYIRPKGITLQKYVDRRKRRGVETTVSIYALWSSYLVYDSAPIYEIGAFPRRKLL